ARLVPSRGHRARRDAVRRSQGRRPHTSGAGGTADRHRAGHPVAHRAVHRGASAREVPVPLAQSALREGGGGMTAVATAPAPSTPAEPLKGSKHWGLTITLGVLAIISLLVFGLGTPSGEQTTFAVARASDFFRIPMFTLPSRATAVVLSIVALLITAYAAYCVQTFRKFPWYGAVLYGVAVLGALLSWAGAGRDATNIQITGLLTGAV